MTSLHFIPVHSSYGEKRAISAKGKNRCCNLSTPPHPPQSIFLFIPPHYWKRNSSTVFGADITMNYSSGRMFQCDSENCATRQDYLGTYSWGK